MLSAPACMPYERPAPAARNSHCSCVDTGALRPCWQRAIAIQNSIKQSVSSDRFHYVKTKKQQRVLSCERLHGASPYVGEIWSGRRLDVVKASLDGIRPRHRFRKPGRWPATAERCAGKSENERPNRGSLG